MDPPNTKGFFYPVPPPASAPPPPPPPPPPSLGIPVGIPAPTVPTTGSQIQSRLPVSWSSGLFNCLDDIPSCLLTCLCPCITFGQIAEIVDGGATSCGASGALYALIMCVTGWSCLFSCFYRSKLRGQYFLEESPCSDCLVHCCCEHCSLCQEYRELKSRGFDMNLGWQGNLERKARAVACQRPPIEGGMSR